MRNTDEKHSLYNIALGDTMRSIEFIQNPSLDMRLTAVQYDGLLLQYIKQQSFHICLTAVQGDGMALKYVDWKLFESSVKIMMILCKVAVMCDGMALQFLPEKIKKYLGINTPHTDGNTREFYSTFY